MAVLITGGSGFIGSFIAKRLIEDGKSVIVLDVQRSERLEKLAAEAKFVNGSVTSPLDIARVFRECDVEGVIHAAADLSKRAEKNHFEAFRTNVEGTLNVLEACKIFKCKKVVFLSSHSVYGPRSGMPITETSFRDPTTFYGATKVCGEVLGTFYSYAHGLDFRAVRFPVVIGPYRSGEGVSVTFSSLIDHAVLRGEVIVDLPPETRMPVIYIKDAVDAAVRLFLADKVPKPIYNVGGIPVSLEELIEVTQRYVNFKVRYTVDEAAKQIASQWMLITLAAERAGLVERYRRIDDIGWELKFDSPEKIVEDHISVVRG